MSDKPLFKTNTAGTKVEVWPNRVVLKKRTFLFFRKNIVIPMSQITNIDLHRGTNLLEIETSNTKHKLRGFRVGKLHEEIVKNM